MTGSVFLQTPPEGIGAAPVFSYPVAPNYIGGANGTVANTAMSLGLVPPAGKRAYITGFDVVAFGATAGSIVQVTLSGLALPGGGNAHYYYLSVPAGATTPCQPFPLTIHFPIPHAASGVGITILLAVPALGAGNTTTNANIRGFWL